MTCFYLCNVCDILSKILSTHISMCHANPTAVSSPRNRQDARGQVQEKKTKALLCFLLMFFLIFLIWTIFKVFIEFVTILLLFYGLFACFSHKACRILALPIWDQTHTLCIGKGSLNHWPTREVRKFGFQCTQKHVFTHIQ